VEQLSQLLASGLALGAIYALVALGFVVIYRASSVFNFAQGELVAFGALAMYSLAKLGLPWPVAVVAAMAATGLLASGVERVILRRMVGRPVFVTIILTLFIGILLRAAMTIVWGPETRGMMATPWEPMATVQLGSTTLLVNSVSAVAAAGLALAAFFLLIRRTRLGVAMRATSSDQEVALALGIPVGRIFGVTWFVAGALAALAGIFLGMYPRMVDINLGFIALRAFPAVIVGGLDSPGGTVIAGLLLGVLELLCQGYINPLLGDFGHNLHAVFPYVVMVLFLVVRPYGLFGTHDVERV